MKKLNKEVFAAWTLMGLAIAMGSACNGSGPGGSGGTGLTGEGAGAPLCEASLLLPDARFTRTSGPDRARFAAVAATPQVVIATTGNGLHRSKDGGDTWSFVDADEVRGKVITTITALGSDLFVATDATIYRSTDGGDTWLSVSTESCSVASNFSVRGSSLFALAGGQAFQWNAAKNGWDALPTIDAAFDAIESDGTFLYANSVYVPGVYRLRLDDLGASWKKIEGLSAWGYHAFAFTSKGAFTANTEHIYRSDDGGTTWSPLESAGDVDVADLLVVNDAIFAATNAGLRVSTDHGATWKSAFAGTFGSSAALAGDGKRVFAATDGVRRSTGPDAAWSKLPVLADEVSWLTATDKSIISVSGGSFQRTTDQGATWVDVKLPGESAYTYGARVTKRGQKLFTLGAGNQLLVSSDDGASFQATPLPAAMSDGWVNLLTTIDRGLVIGVSKGAGSGCSDVQSSTTLLYVSTDEGKTWVESLNGFPTTFVDCYDKEYSPGITSIVEAGDTLLATSVWNGAYRSDSDGYNWQAIETPADIGALHDFVILGETIFAAAEHGGVARSADGGRNWEKAGLSTLPVTAFTTIGDTLFASVGMAGAAADGVYGSADRGLTWSRIDTAFNARVGPLAAQGNHLLAGTLDESIWGIDFGCAATH